MVCSPNLFTPFSLQILYASNNCFFVKPYLASSGFPIKFNFSIFFKGPGLYLKQINSGIPADFSKNEICEMSSRLITAPNFLASLNSSSGVSLDVNIIDSPLIPALSLNINSGKLLQSVPIPSSFNILRINGLGRALTAK